MRGQWIGTYQGSVEGRIIINIDEVADHYEAVASVIPNDNKNIPSSVAFLVTDSKNLNQKLKANTYPIHPDTGVICKWEQIKNRYPADVSHSKTADITIKLTDDNLHINAISDINVELSSILPRPYESDESKIIGKDKSWDDFKNFVSDFSNSKYLFRGQKKRWSLKTSFHRGGRYRIADFIEKDTAQLHKKLSAITPHYFDLTIPDQYGSFLNLVQHHGYPTPLLDWTYSPYVSAFFAFRDWQIGYSDKEKSRIYIFDYDAWEKDFIQYKILDPFFLHLSVMDFIAIDNPRLIPQQAVTTVTNIDDIETYILEREAESKNTYLQAIDIPAKERDIAMRDLRYMGITAGSMFPGIEGVCEEIKERNFNK